MKRIADALESIAENFEECMKEGFPIHLSELDSLFIKEIKDIVTGLNHLGSSIHPITVRID